MYIYIYTRIYKDTLHFHLPGNPYATFFITFEKKKVMLPFHHLTSPIRHHMGMGQVTLYPPIWFTSSHRWDLWMKIWRKKMESL